MTNTESTTTPEPAAAAPQAPRVAPKPATATRRPPPKKKAPKARKGAKTAKPAGNKAAAKPAAHSDTKTALILELIGRKDGATLPEIAKATSWMNHSIRGFISGTVSKRMGLKVESARNESGDRVYRIGK